MRILFISLIVAKPFVLKKIVQYSVLFFLGQEKDISRSYDTRNNNHTKTNETTSAIRIGDQISYFVIAPEKRRWEILKIEAIFTGAICIR